MARQRGSTTNRQDRELCQCLVLLITIVIAFIGWCLPLSTATTSIPTSSVVPACPDPDLEFTRVFSYAGDPAIIAIPPISGPISFNPQMLLVLELPTHGNIVDINPLTGDMQYERNMAEGMVVGDHYVYSIRDNCDVYHRVTQVIERNSNFTTFLLNNICLQNQCGTASCGFEATPLIAGIESEAVSRWETDLTLTAMTGTNAVNWTTLEFIHPAMWLLREPMSLPSCMVAIPPMSAFSLHEYCALPVSSGGPYPSGSPNPSCTTPATDVRFENVSYVGGDIYHAWEWQDTLTANANELAVLASGRKAVFSFSHDNDALLTVEQRVIADVNGTLTGAALPMGAKIQFRVYDVEGTPSNIATLYLLSGFGIMGV